jgi:hypothetical protein
MTAGPVSYRVHSSLSSGFSRMQQVPFKVPFDSFLKRFNKSAGRFVFWLKFALSNLTDRSLQVYLYCGDINFTDIYFVSNNDAVQ